MPGMRGRGVRDRNARSSESGARLPTNLDRPAKGLAPAAASCRTCLSCGIDHQSDAATNFHPRGGKLLLCRPFPDAPGDRRRSHWRRRCDASGLAAGSRRERSNSDEVTSRCGGGVEPICAIRRFGQHGSRPPLSWQGECDAPPVVALDFHPRVDNVRCGSGCPDHHALQRLCAAAGNAPDASTQRGQGAVNQPLAPPPSPSQYSQTQTDSGKQSGTTVPGSPVSPVPAPDASTAQGQDSRNSDMAVGRHKGGGITEQK